MSSEPAVAPRVFVTDFDGTLTRRDFFWLVVERFRPAHLERFWEGYRNGSLTHFEALAGIFANLPVSEADMDDLLACAEPDPDLASWVSRLHDAGWLVVVASAGCEWYIRRILAHGKVDLPVFANPGTFRPGEGLIMTRPTESPFHSPTLGIDKAGLVRHHLDRGSVVAFAGDGFPDIDAARLVRPGLRFARADLATALEREQLPHRRFERWGEVAEVLLRSNDSRDTRTRIS